MDENDAAYILKHLKRVLDTNDIIYWIDCGTLLGAVRDGKIIPWDEDIDIGVWKNEFSKLTKSLEKLPENIHYWHKEQSANVFFKDCNVSIMVYDRKNYCALHSYYIECNYITGVIHSMVKLLEYEGNAIVVSRNIPIPITKIIAKFFSKIPLKIRLKLVPILENFHEKHSSKAIVSVPARYFKNLSTINFYGMEFNVPSPVEEYLEFRYGEDWRIPKKDYVYYRDDGAIIGKENTKK